VNWEATGAIAEILGAAGVIASLLYLAVQVRASTCTSAVEAKLASTHMRTDFLNYLIQYPDLNDLFLRGRKSIDSLSTEEYYRFSNMALHAFSFLSAGYFQFCKGTLSEDDWKETQAVIGFLLRGQGFREWWGKVGRYMFGANFISFVESEMREFVAA
jgi:hypothetical protein